MRTQTSRWTVFALIIVSLVGTTALAGSRDAKRKSELTQREYSAALDDVEHAHVGIELGLAEIDVSRGDEDVLVYVFAEIDEELFDLDFEVERDGSEAYVDIGMDGGRNKSIDGFGGNEFLVRLSAAPVLDLEMDLGLGESEIDLTGLKVSSLDLESGLSETHIRVGEKNKVRAERISLTTGLGELETDHLGNLRFDELEAEAGLGSLKLDLRGFDGEAEVNVEVGMGSCTIVVPRDVGVELHADGGGFFSSIDAPDFRQRDGRKVSNNWDEASSHLILYLSVGMGSIDIRWRD